MTESSIIIQKNDDLGKKRAIIIVQQILLFLLLAGYVFIAILARVTPPDTKPDIDVLQRDIITCANGEKAEICVPSTVTAGEPFEYRTKGKKLVDNSSSIEFQINCKIGGSESITSIGTTPYSNVPKGDFDIKRSTTIPANSRVNSSDSCVFQSIATYTFYQTQNGNEYPIDIQEIGTSNHFKLVVQEDKAATNNSVSSPVAQAPAPSQTSTQDNKTATTSGGTGPNPETNTNKGSSNSNNTQKPGPLQQIVTTVTKPVDGLLKTILGE